MLASGAVLCVLVSVAGGQYVRQSRALDLFGLEEYQGLGATEELFLSEQEVSSARVRLKGKLPGPYVRPKGHYSPPPAVSYRLVPAPVSGWAPRGRHLGGGYFAPVPPQGLLALPPPPGVALPPPSGPFAGRRPSSGGVPLERPSAVKELIRTVDAISATAPNITSAPAQIRRPFPFGRYISV